MAAEINENVEERINLQKALFELEDLNVCNKFELKQLDECLATGKKRTALIPDLEEIWNTMDYFCVGVWYS